MKTRFDNPGVWFIAGGQMVKVEDMSTAHLLNTVKMLTTKLSRSMSMLISDIEESTFADTVWTPFGANSDDKRQSIRNVTRLSAEELREYVIGSPLVQSMLNELTNRGVDVENLLDLFEKPSF